MVKDDFSIPGHVQFLAGYLDAVGRSLTSDAELVSLGCVDSSESAVERDQYKQGCTLVENWSAEFCAFAEEFLRVGTRSRLGFYLVDYLCWFRDLTQGAECYRSAIYANDAASEIVYRIQWPDGYGVLVTASRALR